MYKSMMMMMIHNLYLGLQLFHYPDSSNDNDLYVAIEGNKIVQDFDLHQASCDDDQGMYRDNYPWTDTTWILFGLG